MHLDPVPPASALSTTRQSWHLLAAHVVAEERYRRVGHSGLEPTARGMTTPLAEPVGVELDLDELILRRSDARTRRPVTTIGEAQAWVLGEVGPPRWGEQPGLHDPPARVDPDQPLPIDPAAALWLGGWLSLGHAVLTDLVAEEASVHAGTPTLWPEHFDVGVEVLPAERRASYGVSPGDADHPEPYAYVSLWVPERVPRDPSFDADGFAGALLTAREVAVGPDPAQRLLRYFQQRRDLLARSVGG